MGQTRKLARPTYQRSLPSLVWLTSQRAKVDQFRLRNNGLKGGRVVDTVLGSDKVKLEESVRRLVG